MNKKLLAVGFADHLYKFLRESLSDEDRNSVGEYPGSIFHINRNYYLNRIEETEPLFSFYENIVLAPEPSIYMPAVIPASEGLRTANINSVLSRKKLLDGLFNSVIAPFLKLNTSSRNMFILIPDRRNLDICLPNLDATEIPLLTPLSRSAVKFYGTKAFSRLFGLMFFDFSDMKELDESLRKLALQTHNSEDPFDWLYGNRKNLPEWPDDLGFTPIVEKYHISNSSYYPSAIGIRCLGKNIYLLPCPETDEDSLEFLMSLTVRADKNLDRYQERLVGYCSEEKFKIKGSSTRMKQFCRDLLFAGLEPDGHVLLVGESGSGKELAARAIHDASGREYFKSINCALLSKELAQSEIFGHVKGAFTGAINPVLGYVALADKGSLFFDEIHLLDPQVRGMLLRLIENHEYSRMGSREPLESHVRIIAATNLRSMTTDRDMIASGFIQRFRHLINVPALRYHREDIREYVNIFLESEIDTLKEKHHFNDAEADNIRKHVHSEDEQGWLIRDWRNTNIRGLKNEVTNRVLRLVSDMLIEKDMEKPDAPQTPVQPAKPRGRPPGSKDVLDEDLLKLLKEATTVEDFLERLKGHNSKKGVPYIKTMPRSISTISDPKTRTEAESRYKYLKEQSKISRSKQKP